MYRTKTVSDVRTAAVVHYRLTAFRVFCGFAYIVPYPIVFVKGNSLFFEIIHRNFSYRMTFWAQRLAKKKKMCYNVW